MALVLVVLAGRYLLFPVDPHAMGEVLYRVSEGMDEVAVSARRALSRFFPRSEFYHLFGLCDQFFNAHLRHTWKLPPRTPPLYHLGQSGTRSSKP